jgi:hypothetical protein
MILRHASAAEETSVTGVAGASVNLQGQGLGLGA